MTFTLPTRRGTMHRAPTIWLIDHKYGMKTTNGRNKLK
jgi:hypothetical protein